MLYASIPLVGWLVAAATLMSFIGAVVSFARPWFARWLGPNTWGYRGWRFRLEGTTITDAQRDQLCRTVDLCIEAVKTGELAALRGEPIKFPPRIAVEIYADGHVPPDAKGARNGGIRHSERMWFLSPIWRVALVESTDEIGAVTLHEIIRHMLPFETQKRWDPDHLEKWTSQAEILLSGRLRSRISRQ